MPRPLFHRIYVLMLFIPALITAMDYFPLSIGSRWHYSYFLPEAPIVHHTYFIMSDTIIGQRRYFARQWSSSESNSAIEWLYVSGNDVYKVADLAQPDLAVKIAQKNYTTGDSWIDGSGLAGSEVQLVVSFKGHDSVPAGVFDNTWFAAGANRDTLAGGLTVIRYSINHVYADEVGEIGATVVVLGTTHNFVLDSFYIAPEAGIRTIQRPRVQAENKRVQRITIMESAGDIGRNTDRIYSLSGRLLHSVNIKKIVLRQRLPSGMLIAIPKEDNRSIMH